MSECERERRGRGRERGKNEKEWERGEGEGREERRGGRESMGGSTGEMDFVCIASSYYSTDIFLLQAKFAVFSDLA